MMDGAQHGIEAIGDIIEGKGMLRVPVGHHDEAEGLVRAVGQQHVFRLNPIYRRQPLAHGQAFRIGIQMAAARFGGGRLSHPGRGRIGGFVGVQLDILHILGLFPRNIGRQPAMPGAEEAAHGCPSPFSWRDRTLRAWASRPSDRANSAT